MEIQPIAYSDFYKTDHRPQYPRNTQKVYSNLTPRESRIPGINQVVVWGNQFFCKEILIEQFNREFFRKPKAEVVAKYKRRLDTSLGKDAVSVKHIEELHDLGYLPLLIKALPEGTLCPLRVPCLTITNTHPKFFWLVNFFETVMSNTLWGMMTSATLAYEYRTMLDQACKETSDLDWFVDWQAHDFSMRGMFGIEAAMMSGSGHLLSFTGTDTIPAIDFLEKYYGANAEKEMIGGSVPATEHSVMCMGGKETEVDTFTRLLTEVYPKGIVSIVSDTWDFWNVLENELPKIKDIIMNRDGKLVIRPDSGDPIRIICGDPDSDNPCAQKGAVEMLWDLFGGIVNSKGFKQLDSHIGLIYGDSITLSRCREICRQLKAKGFATTNVVYGVGSYTYQHVTRDTFGFAVKSTYGVIDDIGYDIYKAPKTDSGVKKSAKGLVKVVKDPLTNRLTLIDEITPEDEKTGLLEPIFIDGKLVKETTLAEVRALLKKQVKILFPEPAQYENART
jgi:nicotinamide phosphoribosyltransferase